MNEHLQRLKQLQDEIQACLEGTLSVRAARTAANDIARLIGLSPVATEEVREAFKEFLGVTPDGEEKGA